MSAGFMSTAAAMDITDETSGEKLYQAEDTVKDVVREPEHDAPTNQQKMPPPPSAPMGEAAPAGGAPTGAAKKLHETVQSATAGEKTAEKPRGRKVAPPKPPVEEPPKVTRRAADQGQQEQIADLASFDENEIEAPEGIASIIPSGGPVRLNGGPGRGAPMHDPIAEMLSGMMGGEDLFDEDEDENKEGDYIQEKTTKDGRHIHKEVHNHNGVKQVHMRVEGGPGGIGGMMMGGGGFGPPPGLIEALMGGMLDEHPQKRKQQQKRLGDGSDAAAHAQPNDPMFEDDDDLGGEILMGGPFGGGRIEIRQGPMIMGGRIMEMHDDHEDGIDPGVPPEIQELMRLTEAMIGGGGIFGGPKLIEIPIGRPGMPHPDTPRKDESHDDVMARMEQMTQELEQKGGKRNKKKSKALHIYQIVAIGGVMMFAMLAAFVMTCRANSLKPAVEETEDVQVNGTGRSFDELNSTDISIDETSSSERGMKKSTRANKSD